MVVRRISATQYDVAVRVAGGGRDGRATALGDGHEMMWLRSRQDSVHGDLDVTSSAILEPDRAGEAGGHFAMHLAFRGAGADSCPGHQIGYVLRRCGVEELAPGWHPEIADAQQQLAGYAQAAIDVEASVEIWIVDEALPPYRRPRFFEVDAHDNLEFATKAAAQPLKAFRIL